MRRLARPALFTTLAMIAALVLATCGKDDVSTSPADDRLATRTVEAGDITVEITPLRVDGRVAELKIVFDTHSVALDFDVADIVRLTVGGTEWEEPVWNGDGPGDHHREGTLRFAAGGDPTGTARLDIDGLPDPVSATWELGRD